MRHLLILLLSLFLFTACDSAKFDTEGTVNGSGENANGFEVVTEEEEAEILGEDEETGDQGTQCEGDCPDEDDEGRTPDSEDDDDECEECVICPRKAFEKDPVRDSHSCENSLKEHKINICKWPAGDESKEITLCVAKASLQSLVRKRRQDRYFVGECPSDE